MRTKNIRRERAKKARIVLILAILILGIIMVPSFIKKGFSKDSDKHSNIDVMVDSSLSSNNPDNMKADTANDNNKGIIDDVKYNKKAIEDNSVADSKDSSQSPEISQNNENSKVDNTQKVDENFLNKSIFIGDSITEGISAYGLVDESIVFAEKGLTVLKAGKEIERIRKTNPEEIFILLGVNDLLYGISSSQFVSDYEKLIQNVKSKMPKSKIYIEAIFPVSAKIEQQKPMMSNKRINEFNTALKEMAWQQEVQFLEASSLFKDKNGRMGTEHSSDGIHLKYKSYKLWLEYLSTNAK